MGSCLTGARVNDKPRITNPRQNHDKERFMEAFNTSQLGSSVTLDIGEEETVFKRAASDYEGASLVLALQVDTDDDPFNAGLAYVTGKILFGVGGSTLTVPFTLKRGCLLNIPATAVEVRVKYKASEKVTKLPISVRGCITYGSKPGLGSRADVTYDTQPILLGAAATISTPTPRFSHTLSILSDDETAFYLGAGMRVECWAQATIRSVNHTLILGNFERPDQLYIPSDTDTIVVVNQSGVPCNIITSFGLDI